MSLPGSDLRTGVLEPGRLVSTEQCMCTWFLWHQMSDTQHFLVCEMGATQISSHLRASGSPTTLMMLSKKGCFSHALYGLVPERHPVPLWREISQEFLRSCTAMYIKAKGFQKDLASREKAPLFGIRLNFGSMQCFPKPLSMARSRDRSQRAWELSDRPMHHTSNLTHQAMWACWIQPALVCQAISMARSSQHLDIDEV